MCAPSGACRPRPCPRHRRRRVRSRRSRARPTAHDRWPCRQTTAPTCPGASSPGPRPSADARPHPSRQSPPLLATPTCVRPSRGTCISTAASLSLPPSTVTPARWSATCHMMRTRQRRCVLIRPRLPLGSGRCALVRRVFCVPRRGPKPRGPHVRSHPFAHPSKAYQISMEPTSPYVALVARLVARRTGLGWSQSMLATRIPCPQSSLSRWESLQTVAAGDALLAWIFGLGLSFDVQPTVPVMVCAEPEPPAWKAKR